MFKFFRSIFSFRRGMKAEAKRLTAEPKPRTLRTIGVPVQAHSYAGDGSSKIEEPVVEAERTIPFQQSVKKAIKQFTAEYVLTFNSNTLYESLTTTHGIKCTKPELRKVLYKLQKNGAILKENVILSSNHHNYNLYRINPKYKW